MRLLKINPYFFASFAIFGFLFFHLAKEILTFKTDGWYVGHINLYGDLAFHLTLINKFLESGKVLPDNPIFAGAKIGYPILPDLVTAILSKVAGIQVALFTTTFVTGMLGLIIARLFIKKFIDSERVIFLTFLIFFVNGGLGFTLFLKDWIFSQRPFFEFLGAMPRQYTDMKDLGYWWINNYLAYFLPQRNFLFAFPITLSILGLLYLGSIYRKRYLFLLAGLLAGTMPLIQAHSLFVIFILSVFFSLISTFIYKNKKEALLNWSLFALVTSLIAIPLFRAISSQTNLLEFVRFDPGWTSQENIIIFWLKNLGIFGPLLIAAIIWLYIKNKRLLVLYLPFLFLFAVSNLFVFQPWDFDNSKLLIYWFFASSIVVAYFLHDQFFSENFIKKILGFFLVFILILSGGLDLIRTFTPISKYRIFSNEDLNVANRVKNLTAPDSIFLTAPIHNHPIVALSGRSSLVGYEGWVWSHGLDYQERASDIVAIYQGQTVAEDLIKKYQVSYITVGPLEKSNYRINEIFLEEFPRINLALNWVLYDVSNLWSNDNRQN